MIGVTWQGATFCSMLLWLWFDLVCMILLISFVSRWQASCSCWPWRWWSVHWGRLYRMVWKWQRYNLLCFLFATVHICCVGTKVSWIISVWLVSVSTRSRLGCQVMAMIGLDLDTEQTFSLSYSYLKPGLSFLANLEFWIRKMGTLTKSRHWKVYKHIAYS